jgi:hypothetical protein
MYLILFFIILFVIIIFLVANYIDGPRYLKIKECSTSKLDREYRNKKRINHSIISLTTTPARISEIRPIISSLLDQSVAVDEIRINVPYTSCKGVKYEIPKWLSSLKNVKIYRQIKDWGPATKLIPSLLDKKNKDKRIIILDDDVIYGYNTVETLIEYFDKYNYKIKDGIRVRRKRKTAITMYGDAIKDNMSTDNAFLTRAKNYLEGDKFTDLLRGHSGYIVTPDMFTKDLYDYDKLPKECFFVDDNYFSAHLKKNNVKILMAGLAYKAVPLPEIVTCQLSPLHQTENHDNKNEKIVNRLRE